MIWHKGSVRKVAIRVEKNTYSEGGLPFRLANLIFSPFYTNRETVNE